VTFKIAGSHRIDVSSGKLECEDFGLRFFWGDVYELDSKSVLSEYCAYYCFSLLYGLCDGLTMNLNIVG